MTTTTRQPLTTTTWADLAANQAYLSQSYARAAATRLGWAETSDLAHQLADLHPNLTSQQAGVLTDLCVSQVPVILTWTTELAEGTETTTAAVVIEYLGTEQAYIRYCGFGHWVQLSSITGAETFQTVRTYTQR